MNIILLGAPGAGKGTQAEILECELNIPHISTGDIFREHIRLGTDLGKKAKELIDKGLLISDDITIGIVKDRLKNKDCENGFILDGFPRNIYQAEILEKLLIEFNSKIDRVIYIYVSDEEIVKRIGDRRICPKCGRVYHNIYYPAKNGNICEVCEAEVIQRDDDKEEIVLERLKNFHKENDALLEYYKNKGVLITIEGRKVIDETTKEVLKVVGGIKK